MAPQPSAACVEVFDATSAALPAAAVPAARWGAPAKGKSSKGRAANVPSVPAATGGLISQIKEMGFSEKQAREALAECVWDVNKALDLLFTRGVMGGDDEPEPADNADASANVDASVSKGVVESSPEARSPVKASTQEPPSSGNSPGSADSTEQSTTASSASTPRSSGYIDKASGNAAGASAPLSPQSPIVDSVEEATEEEKAAEVVPEVVEEQARPVAAVPVVEECADKAKTETAHPVETTGPQEASSEKVLTRITRQWEVDSSGAQMHVEEGNFVYIWKSSVTEHGWIYAEDCRDAGKAGWLPDTVMEELPSTQRWMKASQDMQAAHESQLSVVEGSVYKVDIDTRTKEGWIYAETSVTTEDVTEAGWVPAFCLAGADAVE